MEKSEVKKILENEFSIEEMETLLQTINGVLEKKKKDLQIIKKFEITFKKMIGDDIISNMDIWRKEYNGKFKDGNIFWEMYDKKIKNDILNFFVDIKFNKITVGDIFNGNILMENSDSIVEDIKKDIIKNYNQIMLEWRKKYKGTFLDSDTYWDYFNRELKNKIFN